MDLRPAQSRILLRNEPRFRAIEPWMLHGFVNRNVAERMDKLPVAKGEGQVIEQRARARRTAQSHGRFGRALAIPILLAAFTGARQAEAGTQGVGGLIE